MFGLVSRNTLYAVIKETENVPRIISLEKTGRSVVLTFIRNGETRQLELYATMDADIQEMKQWLNLP